MCDWHGVLLTVWVCLAAYWSVGIMVLLVELHKFNQRGGANESA